MLEACNFTCNCCGKTYSEMPLTFGADQPEYYFSIPVEERSERVEITESLCVIDDHYFHRGRIVIPIIGHDETLNFNVWTTISKENFELRNYLWNSPGRVSQKPYFGWLQTVIETYADTLNIKTIASENEVGLIPDIEVIEEEHQLFVDQQNGITVEEAVVKVQQILAQLHQK